MDQNKRPPNQLQSRPKRSLRMKQSSHASSGSNKVTPKPRKENKQHPLEVLLGFKYLYKSRYDGDGDGMALKQKIATLDPTEGIGDPTPEIMPVTSFQLLPGPKGLGIIATHNIPPKTCLMEYVGVVKETQSGDKYNNYTMQLLEGIVIDASSEGNLLRFVNHSCEPNCCIEHQWIDGECRPFLFSTKTIKQHQELSYKYKFEYGEGEDRVKCECNSKKCTGFLGISLEEAKKQKDKSIICDKCGKHFTRTSSLNEHIDSVHSKQQRKRFECSPCDKTFAAKRGLNRHVRLKHSTQPPDFICKECAKHFNRKDALDRHLKNCHQMDSKMMEQLSEDESETNSSSTSSSSSSSDILNGTLEDEKESHSKSDRTGASSGEEEDTQSENEMMGESSEDEEHSDTGNDLVEGASEDEEDSDTERDMLEGASEDEEEDSDTGNDLVKGASEDEGDSDTERDMLEEASEDEEDSDTERDMLEGASEDEEDSDTERDMLEGASEDEEEDSDRENDMVEGASEDEENESMKVYEDQVYLESDDEADKNFKYVFGQVRKVREDQHHHQQTTSRKRKNLQPFKKATQGATDEDNFNIFGNTKKKRVAKN